MLITDQPEAEEVVVGALVKILGALGIVGFIAFGLLWVALNVDKIQVIAGLIASLFRGVSAYARRVSTKLQVEGRANQLLDETLFKQMEHEPSLPPVRLELHLVQQATDPSIHSDGRVIVRMRDEGDATRNILRLVKTAAPQIMIPDARPFLEAKFCEAVDLQLVRKIARKLGPQAQRIFHTDYLTRAHFADDPPLRELLQQLEIVDEGGFFESVLLQEIGYIGMRARDVMPDVDVVCRETREFVQLLLRLTTRAPGEEQELMFSRQYYRVAFILLARREIADLGLPPYVRRLQIDVSLGAESIYVLSLTSGHTPLFREVVKAFGRVPSVEQKLVLQIYNRRNSETQMLSLFRRSDFSPAPGAFRERLEAEGINVGTTVRASVLATGSKHVNLSVDGIPAQLHSKDIAWGYLGPANAILKEGAQVEALVIEIDEVHRELGLSMKVLHPNPWELDPTSLSEGEIHKISVITVMGQSLIVFLDKLKIFGVVAQESWLLPDEDATGVEWEHLIGATAEARVVEGRAGRDYLRLSRRAIVVDRATVVEKYPRGCLVTVRVLRLEVGGIVCQIEPGVTGWLERADIEAAGYEFRNWRKNVVPGQGLELVVRRFQSTRERFTLEFPRTRWTA